ncbi:MAG: hypothetical protein HY692_05440, partial [Cyanobacteria bacterium NC_groundwater_1444_Ag_S-0.65um_54_12]|nr:hypothetical protein [Cyanobacteria bacterium NC_groundwater_1444_Ag_S-0.65um_54_12]
MSFSPIVGIAGTHKLMRSKLLFYALVMGLSAGLNSCGTSITTVSDTGGQLKDLRLAPAKPGGDNPQLSKPDPSAEIAQLRYAVSQTYSRNNNIHALVTNYIKNVQTGELFSSKMDYWFQKPQATAIYIREASKT